MWTTHIISRSYAGWSDCLAFLLTLPYTGASQSSEASSRPTTPYMPYKTTTPNRCNRETAGGIELIAIF